MAKVKQKIPTQTQESAGGAAFRAPQPHVVEVALISVGTGGRWQLPKGLIDFGESPEVAAVREVREEAGIDAAIIEKIDTVEYWYQATVEGERVRYHKFVHFFLMRFLSGDVANHDREVNEARWVGIQDALAMIAFKSEREVLEKAMSRILSKDPP
jgi:8-oxo-dGTP pyrophosphatase MutT (NUDIX family)